MSRTKSLKCINALDLKLMAMLFMLCDHLWATLIPGAQWLTILGRIAFPIFAFQIAEGYAHTHSFKRYLKRMFLFALVSEIPFNLMYVGDSAYRGFFSMLTSGHFDATRFLRLLTGLLFHQNVMFTFCIALLFLRLLDRAKAKGLVPYLLALPLAAVGGYLAGTVTFVDYFGYGVLTVLLFYVCRDVKWGWLGVLLGMIVINCFMIGGRAYNFDLFGLSLSFPEQGFALLALLPIWLYNGEQGPHSKAIQYFGYAFYPAHMLILAILALYVIQ